MDALAPLTVVSGLPGTGKTTLLASWSAQLEQSGAAVIWLSVGPEGLGELRLDQLAAARQGRVVVILDQADHITDPTIMADLCDLLDLESNLHLVLSSRAIHPLSALAEARNLPTTTLTTADLLVRPSAIRTTPQRGGTR